NLQPPSISFKTVTSKFSALPRIASVLLCTFRKEILMLENDSAANGTGGNDAVETLPTNAPAAPPIPVSPSPATGAPATPAAQPNAPAKTLPAHENRPTHSFAESIRHALIGGTLGAMAKTAKVMAGPQPTQYTTDESGRTIPDPKQRPDNVASRLERIAQAA